MDHSYYKERISAYADNALPPYEQMAVQEHVQSCAECQAALEKILKLSAWTLREADLRGVDYFEKQAQKIEARLGLVRTEVTPVGKKVWRGLGWKLTSVAASIALVGIVVYLSKDTVLQKSETPGVDAPAVTEEKKSDNILPPENVGLNSIRPETTANRPGLKGEVMPVETDEKSVEEPAKFKKSTAPIEDQNYKTSPQMMAPIEVLPDTDASESAQKPQSMPEQKPVSREDVKLESVAGTVVESTAAKVEAKRDVISKFQVSGQLSKTAEQIKSMPVQKVDELIKSAPGVKTDSSGKVFIRGGRAGEVEYIVDGVPIPDPASRTPIKEESGILAYWRTVRDSLERARQAGASDKVASLANRLIPKETSSATLPIEPIKINATLAEAYFRIAKISRDSTEITRATDSLKNIAADSKSKEQALAKAYLDSLGLK